MQAERKIFNARPLFYGFLSLLLAIASTRFLFNGDYVYFALIGAVLVLFIAYCIWKSRFVSLIVVASAFLFGVGWYFVGVASFTGQTYTEICQVEGRVTDDISFYYDYEFVLLKDVKINGESQKNINLTIMLTDDEELEVGDKISFEANVDNVKLFELGSFNSSCYREGAPYKSYVEFENINITGNELAFDESVRQNVKAALYENMGETYGAVGYAVLFGNKSEVDPGIKDIFTLAGVIHILTVSGLHVSFLIGLIGFVLKKCKVRGWLNLLICAIFLGLYAYLCGFAPSVMRAGIMGLVLLATKISGKCYDNLNSLGLAGVIILLINPLSAFDVGFLMSFFCVLGIFVISPWVSKILRKIFPKTISESFGISIGAQIGVLPSMSTFFGSFNLLSFFVNLIVVPIFSIIYPVMFVFAFLTPLMPFLGFALKACGWGLELLVNISSFFASTIFSVQLWPISVIVVALAFLAFFLLGRHSMLGKKAKIICCSALFALSTVFGVVDQVQQPVAGVSYTYYQKDDCVIVTNSNGKTLAVDLNANAKNVMSVCDLKNISTALVLEFFVQDIDFYRELGVQTIYSCRSSRYYDEEVLVEKNVPQSVDGFAFCYLSVGNVLVALEILFDDTNLLIFRDGIIGENYVEKLPPKDYDFVFVGTNVGLAKYFSAGCVVQGYKEGDNIDKNYLQHGNSFYKIKQNEFEWRCLD